MTDATDTTLLVVGCVLLVAGIGGVSIRESSASTTGHVPVGEARHNTHI
jgi:hypothetical protein